QSPACLRSDLSHRTSWYGRRQEQDHPPHISNLTSQTDRSLYLPSSHFQNPIPIPFHPIISEKTQQRHFPTDISSHIVVGQSILSFRGTVAHQVSSPVARKRNAYIKQKKGGVSFLFGFLLQIASPLTKIAISLGRDGIAME